MTASEVQSIVETFTSSAELFAWVRQDPEHERIFWSHLVPTLFEDDGHFLYLNEESPAPLFAGHPAGVDGHSAGAVSDRTFAESASPIITAESLRESFLRPRRLAESDGFERRGVLVIRYDWCSPGRPLTPPVLH